MGSALIESTSEEEKKKRRFLEERICSPFAHAVQEKSDIFIRRPVFGGEMDFHGEGAQCSNTGGYGLLTENAIETQEGKWRVLAGVGQRSD